MLGGLLRREIQLWTEIKPAACRIRPHGAERRQLQPVISLWLHDYDVAECSSVDTLSNRSREPQADAP
jgi:hypothetical protein